MAGQGRAGQGRAGQGRETVEKVTDVRECVCHSFGDTVRHIGEGLGVGVGHCCHTAYRSTNIVRV